MNNHHFPPAQPNQEIPAEQQAGAGGVPHARVGTFSEKEENRVSKSAEQSRDNLSSTPAHTPGPWFITNSGRLPIYFAAQDGRWKDNPGTILGTVGGNMAFGTGDFQEDLANARLIAAAPDMLAALRSAEEWMSCVEPHLRDGQTFKRDRETIRAAIAKATEGRS